MQRNLADVLSLLNHFTFRLLPKAAEDCFQVEFKIMNKGEQKFDKELTKVTEYNPC